jgi:hypothetical protein
MMSYSINHTMMRINSTPMKPGASMSFSIKWFYNINNTKRRRTFSMNCLKKDNKIYVIAQFYPRMAVYNDVKGGKTCSFGEAENLLFGNFDVNITVPADHVMEATGDLMNRSEVFTPAQVKDGTS